MYSDCFLFHRQYIYHRHKLIISKEKTSSRKNNQINDSYYKNDYLNEEDTPFNYLKNKIKELQS